MAFARVALALAAAPVFPTGTRHLVPADEVSKHRLCELIAQSYGRSDLVIEPVITANPIDRTLATEYPQSNVSLWAAAGYAAPQTIGEMVNELAREGRSRGESRD